MKWGWFAWWRMLDCVAVRRERSGGTRFRRKRYQSYSLGGVTTRGVCPDAFSPIGAFRLTRYDDSTEHARVRWSVLRAVEMISPRVMIAIQRTYGIVAKS